jgi:hypothetical protein
MQIYVSKYKLKTLLELTERNIKNLRSRMVAIEKEITREEQFMDRIKSELANPHDDIDSIIPEELREFEKELNDKPKKGNKT